MTVPAQGGSGGGLRVRGGDGGIAVRVEDLEAAAALLTSVAAGLTEVTVRAGRVAADPQLVATGLLAPASLAAVEARFAAALLGPAGAAAAGVRLGLLALRLRAAAAGYAATEARVVVLLRELEDGGATATAVDVACGLTPGGGPALAGLLGTAGRVSPVLAETGAVEVGVSPPVPVPPPTGVADLLGRVAAASSGPGVAPGTVTVDEVRAPGGGRAFVVAIPGTQAWSPVPAEDPLDLTADVAALSGARTAAAAGVVRALEAAGARPGEPVLLVGHSLGGMLAAQLAADPTVRARFTVTCVVTAGSPVARYAVPADVAVLSLEHDDDVVPALDGAANPDRARWVTVRRPSGARQYPPDPARAHASDAYAATGAAVDASNNPSLIAWRSALAPFIAGPGVTAVQTVVVARRGGRRAVPRQLAQRASAVQPSPRRARSR